MTLKHQHHLLLGKVMSNKILEIEIAGDIPSIGIYHFSAGYMLLRKSLFFT